MRCIYELSVAISRFVAALERKENLLGRIRGLAGSFILIVALEVDRRGTGPLFPSKHVREYGGVDLTNLSTAEPTRRRMARYHHPLHRQ